MLTHGDGTKLATTKNSTPPARLLDITRLISRAGRVLTGVDRVELAYLDALSSRSEPAFAVSRTRFGYILLGPDAIQPVVQCIRGLRPWGSTDRLSRYSRGRPAQVRAAESELRRLSLSRCLPRGLGRMLRRHLPAGFSYLNVGHSNLTARMLSDARSGGCGRIAVFVHDTIPLDYPQYQRAGTPVRFSGMLSRVQTYADVVICNSDATQADVKRHMDPGTVTPSFVTAHLGLDLAPPNAADLPNGLLPEGPYFVAVGTIEPRKRYDLLLDVWDRMAAPPPLFLCGSRGWNNDAVFARLDALHPDHPVTELSDLSDGAIAALVENATALLMPSDAEGYGLPAIEAAALGVPLICQKLPVFGECLQDIPIYVHGPDVYLWKENIERLLQQQKSGVGMENRKMQTPPDWDTHFKKVLTLI